MHIRLNHISANSQSTVTHICDFTNQYYGKNELWWNI